MTKQERCRIAIIGGGAAGMTAAICAARRGARITVLERMHRVGKKLLATGNGRCNMSNTNIDIGRYHGGNPDFILQVFDLFDARRTLSFFRELGIEPVIEADGYVYPASGQASSVLDVMRYEMEQLGVDVVCDVKINRIEKQEKGFLCAGADGEEHTADRVIIAAGGKSSPNLGSDGSGFKLADRFGHTVKRPFPALVQICLDSPYLKRMAGVRVRSGVESRIDGKVYGRERGELLFTDYGISGIPAMQLSRPVSEYAGSGKDMSLHLDLFPDLSREDLETLIAGRVDCNPQKSIEMSFVGLIHKRLIEIVLRESGSENIASECGGLSKPSIRNIAERLKDWTLRCTGVKSWMFSQVTAGGVDVDQVNPFTMESRIVRGIYFAGEILDVDGDCGGYNLQWAWSTGYVAGTSAAE